jgi:acyl-CoA thioester hydrolase
MYSFDYQKRVRYGETDQMGYLYYGNYATYYEIGRVEMLRSLGLTYKHMEEELQVMMPVVNLQVRYLRPAKYDDLITIRTILREPPGEKYITFHMELFNEAGKLINAGSVKLCFVDMNTFKTVPPPSYLDAKIDPFF